MDLNMAHTAGLVSDQVQWNDWVAIVEGVSNTAETVNKRYEHGELRLSRLNKICWARGELRGYHFPYQTYAEMFKANIAPIAVLTVYLSVVLAATQVGLATNQLSGSTVFHKMAYGMTMLAIFGPIGLLAIVAVVVMVHVVFNALFTLAFPRKERKRGPILPI